MKITCIFKQLPILLLAFNVYIYICHVLTNFCLSCINRVRNYLNEKLANRWIGRRGSLCEFPPRSPDLTACDYWLWGYLREQVYTLRYHTLRQLRDALEQKLTAIPTCMFENALKNFHTRCEMCMDNGGFYIE